MAQYTKILGYSIGLLIVGGTVTQLISIEERLPSAQTMLEKIKTLPKDIHNLYVEVVWDDFELEPAVSRARLEKMLKSSLMDKKTHTTLFVPEFHKHTWVEQIIYSDDLGRIRRIEKHGYYDADGHKVKALDMPETDHLYDGEKTVDQRYNLNRERNGRPVEKAKGAKSEPANDNKLEYRTANIQDGDPHPNRVRNALTFTNRSLSDPLERAIAEGSMVTVKRNVNDKNVFDLHFRLGNENTQLQYSGSVDAARGWLVTNINMRNRSGRVLSAYHCEYRRRDGDFWIPSEGWYRGWKADEAADAEPSTEWRFRIQKIKINDLDFPADIFDVVLEPGTVVMDARYKVTYEVGADKVYDADLAALAEQAKAGAHRNTTDRTTKLYKLWMFVAMNLALLVGVTVFMIIRKYRKRHAPGTP